MRPGFLDCFVWLGIGVHCSRNRQIVRVDSFKGLTSIVLSTWIVSLALPARKFPFPMSY